MQLSEHTFRQLAIVIGLFGVGIWIPIFSGFGFYSPPVPHSEIMIGAFLPILYRSFYPFGRSEFVQISNLIILFLIASIFINQTFFRILSSLLFLLLLVAPIQTNNTKELAPVIFSKAGLILGFLGTISYLVSSHTEFSDFYFLGKLFLLYGSLLLVSIGIGSEAVQRNDKTHGRFESDSAAYIFTSLIVISLIVEAFWHAGAAQVLRAILVTMTVFFFWILPSRGFPKLLTIAAVALILANWTHLLFHNYSKHLLHLMFISGFALLFIARSFKQSDTSDKVTFSILSMIVTSAILRVLAPIVDEYFNELLTGAAAVWCVALLLALMGPVVGLSSRSKRDLS